MILIFGGAYQGKLEYAKENFHISDEDIFFCQENSLEPDLSKKVIYGLESFIFACVKEGVEAKDLLSRSQDLLADKIIIVSDISQGIVPMDPTERQWREMVGRTMLWLGKQSDKVIRVFCGLGQNIK